MSMTIGTTAGASRMAANQEWCPTPCLVLGRRRVLDNKRRLIAGSCPSPQLTRRRLRRIRFAAYRPSALEITCLADPRCCLQREQNTGPKHLQIPTERGPDLSTMIGIEPEWSTSNRVTEQG